MKIISNLRGEILLGKCKVATNEIDEKSVSANRSKKAPPIKKSKSSTSLLSNQSENVSSEMGHSVGVVLKVEKAKLIFKKGSKRYRAALPGVESEGASPVTNKESFLDKMDKKGEKKSERLTLEIENGRLNKIKKSNSVALNQLDRKLESNIAGLLLSKQQSTLKSILKYKKSENDFFDKKGKNSIDDDTNKKSKFSYFKSSDTNLLSITAKNAEVGSGDNCNGPVGKRRMGKL
jgi:hypothetical protein